MVSTFWLIVVFPVIVSTTVGGGCFAFSLIAAGERVGGGATLHEMIGW